MLGARVGEVVKRTKGKWLEAKLIKAFTNPLRFFFNLIKSVAAAVSLIKFSSFLIPKDIHIMLKLVERAEYNTYKVMRPITMLLAMDLIELQKTC